MKRKLMLLLACLYIGIGLVTAQTQKVTGIVISEEDGQPIIGASVLVKGTKIGAITGIDGDFTIPNAPSSAKVLQVSYIGMLTQEVGIKPNVRIVLKADNKMLDEVVVVAYGTASKQSLTGAVASIDAKKLEMRPVTEVTGTLEGVAPGIQVNNTYGEPGNDKASIRIRGFSSINGTNDPLIVVDGSPYGGSLNDINPQDIESISVLKDASSAALYGNKAANGVVLINTKKGKNHKLNFRMNVKQGTYTRGIPEYDKLGMNQWMETMRSGWQSYFEKDAKYSRADAFESSKWVNDDIIFSPIFDKIGEDQFDANGKFIANVKKGYSDLNWVDALERTGYRQEYGVSADAMGDNYDIFSSFGYLNEKGYIIGSDYDRYTARLKANFQPIKWFKTGLSLSGTMGNSNYQSNAKSSYYGNPFYTAGKKAPVYPYYKHNEDGSISTDESGQNIYDTDNYDYLSGRNIIYELKNDISRKNRNSISGQIYGTVSFLNDFAATIKGDLYNANSSNKGFNNPICGDGAANNGRLSKEHSRTREYRFNQELTWGKDFEKHHVDVLVGHESFKHTYNYDFSMKEQMKVSGNTEMSNFSRMSGIEGYSKVYTTESYLSRARYNFDEKYFADASFRRDGSSRFSNPWGNFWSLGASWIISKENFMKSIKWVDNLKLRASYGEVGNDAGVDYYAYKELYYSDINAGIGAFYKTQIPNKKLKWETSGSFDIALEGRLFERFNFSLDYFYKKSKDLLFTVYNPLSAGATSWSSGDDATGMSQYYANVGSVRNSGLEIALDADVLHQNDWKWNVGLNLTTLSNKITKLPGGKDILHGTQNYSEGHSVYEFYTYTYAGVDQMNGRALYNANSALSESKVKSLKAGGEYVTINDKNYVYNTSYAEKDWQGSALPDVYGSISTALSWKNLTLSVLCTYSLGGKVYDYNYQGLMYTTSNGVSALHKDVLKGWTSMPEGMTEASADRLDPKGTPQFDLSSLASTSYGASSRWLSKASYFIIKNINLNYTFPSALVTKWGLGGLSVYGTVENAATFTDRKGMNPQYSFSGSQDNTFVTARVFTLGVNLNF